MHIPGEAVEAALQEAFKNLSVRISESSMRAALSAALPIINSDLYARLERVQALADEWDKTAEVTHYTSGMQVHCSEELRQALKGE